MTSWVGRLVFDIRCINLNLHVGYVSHFILDTARISQLFCHQIIWNMKANCYKDDNTEVVRLFQYFLETVRKS